MQYILTEEEYENTVSYDLYQNEVDKNKYLIKELKALACEKYKDSRCSKKCPLGSVAHSFGNLCLMQNI